MVWVFSDIGAECIINLNYLRVGEHWESRSLPDSEVEPTSEIASIEESTCSGAL